MSLSGATSPGQNGPGSHGNEEVLCIPQKLQHYRSLKLFNVIIKTLIGEGGSYPSAEMQLVYSTPPANWAMCRKGSRSDARYVNIHCIYKVYSVHI